MKRRAMLSVVAMLAMAMVLLAQAAETGVNQPAEPIRTMALAAAHKGLDWLKSQQKENGAWSSEYYPALTGLPLWAFARSDHPAKNAVCAKATEFVTKFVQPDGGIYKPAVIGSWIGGGLATYNTAICMAALYSYDPKANARVILNARKFVASCQVQGASDNAGGFGYGQPPKKGEGRVDLSNSAWVMEAMRVTQPSEDLRRGGERVDVDWEAARKFVDKHQNRDPDSPAHDGGFGYAKGERGKTYVAKDGTVRLMGYGSMTYAGLESMIYAEVDRHDPRVASALRWAACHWSVEENPGTGAKGLFYYYNIMSKALSLFGDTIPAETGNPIPWKRQLVAKLVAIQRPDGSWVNRDNSLWEGNPVLVTAYTVLALEYAAGQ
jgi:squalene-hopene/tetraprenyl-beta-curcumene cyclase